MPKKKKRDKKGRIIEEKEPKRSELLDVPEPKHEPVADESPYFELTVGEPVPVADEITWLPPAVEPEWEAPVASFPMGADGEPAEEPARGAHRTGGRPGARSRCRAHGRSRAPTGRPRPQPSLRAGRDALPARRRVPASRRVVRPRSGDRPRRDGRRRIRAVARAGLVEPHRAAGRPVRSRRAHSADRRGGHRARAPHQDDRLPLRRRPAGRADRYRLVTAPRSPN